MGRDNPGAARQPANATEPFRALGFSDGCFAIIITLLVIEIRRPHADPGKLGEALLEAWPSYAAFALAFVYVGVIWLNHHGLFHKIARMDRRLHAYNLAIIGTSALIPFPTGVLAEAFESGNLADQRAAVALYALIAGMMSAAWAPVFPYLEKRRELLAPDVPPGYFASQRSRPWIGIAAYLVAVALGYLVSPWAAIIVFVGMVAFHAFTSDGWAKRGREPMTIREGGSQGADILNGGRTDRQMPVER